MKVTAVIVGIVCLIAGFAAGYKFADSRAAENTRADLEEVRFARTIGAITTSTQTLSLIDQRRADQIQQLHEKMLAEYARDARDTVRSARHVGDRAAGIDQTLSLAVAYAQRRGMKDTVADLTAVHDTLKAIVASKAIAPGK